MLLRRLDIAWREFSMISTSPMKKRAPNRNRTFHYGSWVHCAIHCNAQTYSTLNCSLQNQEHHWIENFKQFVDNQYCFQRQSGLLCFGHNQSTTHDSAFEILGNQVPLVLISFVWRLNCHQRHWDGMPEGQWFHQAVVIQSISCIVPRSLWLVTQLRASVKILISCQSDCITNHDFSSVPLTLIHAH